MSIDFVLKEPFEVNLMTPNEWKSELTDILNYAVSFESFSKRIQAMNDICSLYPDKILYLGKGSSRSVYDIGNGEVFKMAINGKGLSQNYYEAEPHLDNYDVINKISEKSDEREYFEYRKFGNRTFAFDDSNKPVNPGNIASNRYIIADKAGKINSKEFKELNDGVSFSEFSKNVGLMGAYFANTRISYPSEAENALSETTVGAKILDLLHYYGNQFPVGDLCRLSSYGTISDGDSKDVVLIDYGLRKDNLEILYSPKKEADNRFRMGM